MNIVSHIERPSLPMSQDPGSGWSIVYYLDHMYVPLVRRWLVLLIRIFEVLGYWVALLVYSGVNHSKGRSVWTMSVQEAATEKQRSSFRPPGMDP